MRKNQVSKICPVCGSAFSVKASHALRSVYCSRPCMKIGRRRERQIELEQQYGQPIYDLLYDLYHSRGMGIKEIARLLDMSDHTLWNWFDELGIPRRALSDAVKLQWKGNEERRSTFGNTIRSWKQANPDATREHSVIGNLSQQNMRGPTSIERCLMDALDAAGIHYQFQYSVGDKFLCDFAFPEAMLIVECDGEYWHSKPCQRRQDASKDAYLQACGYTVLRFSDKQIETNIHGCVRAILELLS